MDDFRTAFTSWVKDKRLLCKEIGEMLDPPVSASVISNWVNGIAEPKKGHRGQLVKLARGYIKPHHFL